MRSLGLLLCLALLSSSAEAESLTHVLADGETLERVARDYYGDARFARALAVANRLAAGEPTAGVELRVPSATAIRVREGETWRSLARDHWGAAELGPELARFLERDPATPVSAGESLQIPVLIPWKVESGDTLVSMSRSVYGSAGGADALARLNRVRDPRRLRVGSVLRVPFPKLARGVAAPVSAPPPERVESLRRAVNAYLDGRYDEALGMLEELRTPVLADGDAAEREQLFRHLLFTYVAFERNQDACAAHRVLRGSGSEPALDPDLVSPKILDAVAACE